MKSIVLFLALFSTVGYANSQSFKSSGSKVHLLELYSSQGCSSCPPAEHWVSRLTSHPDLWSKFIPVVFHVDYWNYLGWKDPFSRKSFSKRQRTYFQQNALKSVYTPGFLLDGQEWRNWYRDKHYVSTQDSEGTLTAKLEDSILTVNYSQKAPLQLNVALLGFGIETQVLRGENRGRNFIEDFIVLSLESRASDNGSWSLPVKNASQFNARKYALAIWVNSTESLKPIQATGGWVYTND